MKVNANGSEESAELGQQAWVALARCLPPRDVDSNAWWQLTGRQLAALAEAFGYTIDKQYEMLLTHYHWMIPYLGPARRSTGEKNALNLPSITRGSVYWWKWDAGSGGEPEVGWAIEPRGRFAGTELDPLNHEALREFLYCLATALPSTDNSWSKRLQETLFEGQDRKFLIHEQPTDGPLTHRRNTLVGTELTPQGPRFRTHFRDTAAIKPDSSCRYDPI